MSCVAKGDLPSNHCVTSIHSIHLFWHYAQSEREAWLSAKHLKVENYVFFITNKPSVGVEKTTGVGSVLLRLEKLYPLVNTSHRDLAAMHVSQSPYESSIF